MDASKRALYTAICAGGTATALELLARSLAGRETRFTGNATPLLLAAYRRRSRGV